MPAITKLPSQCNKVGFPPKCINIVAIQCHICGLSNLPMVSITGTKKFSQNIDRFQINEGSQSKTD